MQYFPRLTVFNFYYLCILHRCFTINIIFMETTDIGNHVMFQQLAKYRWLINESYAYIVSLCT